MAFRQGCPTWGLEAQLAWESNPVILFARQDHLLELPASDQFMMLLFVS